MIETTQTGVATALLNEFAPGFDGFSRVFPNVLEKFDTGVTARHPFPAMSLSEGVVGGVVGMCGGVNWLQGAGGGI